MIEVIPARPQHVGPIANRMREIDALECLLLHGMSPKEALRWGLIHGSSAWTVKINGKPEAMFGVVSASMMEGRGRVWLLMTDEAASSRKALVRLGARYTEAMHRHFTILENYVHADNEVAARWLSRLGYVVGHLDTIRGVPVRPFYRVAIGG